MAHQSPQASMMSQVVNDGDSFSFPADRDLWNNLVTQVRLYPGAMDPPHFHIDATHTDESIVVNQEFLRRFVAGWERANPHAVKLATPQGGTQFHASEEFWSRFVHISDPHRTGGTGRDVDAYGQPAQQAQDMGQQPYEQQQQPHAYTSPAPQQPPYQQQYPPPPPQQQYPPPQQTYQQSVPPPQSYQQPPPQQYYQQPPPQSAPPPQSYQQQAPPPQSYQQQPPPQQCYQQPPPQQSYVQQPPPQQSYQPPPQQPPPPSAYQQPPPQPSYQQPPPEQRAGQFPPPPQQPQQSATPQPGQPVTNEAQLAEQGEEIDRNRGEMAAKEAQLEQQQRTIDQLRALVQDTTQQVRGSMDRDARVKHENAVAQRDIDAHQREIAQMKQRMDGAQRERHGERAGLENRLRQMEQRLQGLTDEVSRGNEQASREIAERELQINQIRQASTEQSLRKELELREMMQNEIDKQCEEARMDAEHRARNAGMAQEIADLRATLQELATQPVEPMVIAPLPGPPPPPRQVKAREGPSEADKMAVELSELKAMLAGLKNREPECPPGMQMVPVSALPPGALAQPGSIRRVPAGLQQTVSDGMSVCAPPPGYR